MTCREPDSPSSASHHLSSDMSTPQIQPTEDGCEVQMDSDKPSSDRSTRLPQHGADTDGTAGLSHVVTAIDQQSFLSRSTLQGSCDLPSSDDRRTPSPPYRKSAQAWGERDHAEFGPDFKNNTASKEPSAVPGSSLTLRFMHTVPRNGTEERMMVTMSMPLTSDSDAALEAAFERATSMLSRIEPDTFPTYQRLLGCSDPQSNIETLDEGDIVLELYRAEAQVIPVDDLPTV